MKATLALENGVWYDGESAGAASATGGEVVFNTSMTGYQEVLTDPSYAGTDRHDDVPGDRQLRRHGRRRRIARAQVAGFIVRDESPMASNWRAEATLRDYLSRHNIVAISDIDTRALTRLLRSGGVMRGVIATGDARSDGAGGAREGDSADGRSGSGAGRHAAPRRSTGTPEESDGRVRASRRSGVPAAPLQDRGLRLRDEVEHPAPLDARTAATCVCIPATTPASELLATNRTACSSATAPAIRRCSTYAIGNAKELVEVRRAGVRHLPRPPDPGLAMGARTYKLKFGHRGANHPVKDLRVRQDRDHVAESRVRRWTPTRCRPTST